MTKYALKSQTVFMGAGLTRRVWAIWYDGARKEWFTDQEEAQNKFNALLRDEEGLNG